MYESFLKMSQCRATFGFRAKKDMTHRKRIFAVCKTNNNNKKNLEKIPGLLKECEPQKIDLYSLCVWVGERQNVIQIWFMARGVFETQYLVCIKSIFPLKKDLICIM